MEHLEVSRQVDRSPAAVFATVQEFRGYPAYSEYLTGVSVEGDGEPGTEYVLEGRVVGLSFDVRTRLDRLDSPHRIEWSVLGEFQATGCWTVQPDEDGAGSILELVVEYDPESVDSNVVSLPFGMSFEWLKDKAESLAEREVETVLERIATELETDVQTERGE